MKLRRTVVLSARILGAHKLRTALSVCGLLVGVAVVMVMTAVGAGAERRVLDQVHAMGTDLLVVSAAPAPRIAGREQQAEVVTFLREADAAALVNASLHARSAAPAVSRSVVLHFDGRNVPTTLSGTTPAGLRIQRIRATRGRLFDDVEEHERRRVAVLGARLADHLFRGADPIGRIVRVGSVPFEVVGVAAPRGADPAGADLDDRVIVPLATAMRRVLNIAYVHSILIQAASLEALRPLEADVREALAPRIRPGVGTVEPFRVLNQADLVHTARTASGAFRSLIVGVAGLSLFVGGLGILVVMRIALRERIREIGLRRAVGARQRDVYLQFVIESGLLAAAGALAGVVIGVLATLLATTLGPWELVLSWRAAWLGTACSVAVGVAAGLLPARRAARQEPVQALRGGVE